MDLSGLPLDRLPDLVHVLLGASALAFLWVAVAAPRMPRQGTGPLPDVAHPGDGFGLWYRPRDDDASLRDMEMLRGQLRHPMGGAGLAELPPPLQAALLVLGAAVVGPSGIDGPTERLVAGIVRHPERPYPGGIPGKAALEAIEDAAKGHGWWECVAVELMARARRAGSWVTPHDLRFLAGPEPALLAALCAGPGGTVSPDGAGIVAHHMSERVMRWPMLEPNPDPALSNLHLRLSGMDAA
jgi:hypothetical protein